MPEGGMPNGSIVGKREPSHQKQDSPSNLQMTMQVGVSDLTPILKPRLGFGGNTPTCIPPIIPTQIPGQNLIFSVED